MKTRLGFVSNSSSSSFIVLFRNYPRSIKDVERVLFPNGGTFESRFQADMRYPAGQVAATVWQDINNQKPNDKEEAINILGGSWEAYDEYKEYHQMTPSDTVRDWDDYNRKARIYGEREYHKFRDEYPNFPVMYIFRYSDNDGDYYADLEHGDLFESLPHRRINNH